MSATLVLAGQRLTAALLNSNIPGPWAPITLLNGWTNHGTGQATFQIRQVNSVTLEVIGNIVPGTITAGTQIGSIPSTFPMPASAQNMPAGAAITGGTGSGASITVFVTAAGAISIQGGTVSGMTQMAVHFFISLDA